MSKGSRRGFWSNLLGVKAEWAPVFKPATQGETPAGEASWIVASRQAMGTFFELRMASYTPGSVALAEQCFDLIDDLEMEMTIYRDDSTIARMNARYHDEPFKLNPGLYELLTLARSIHQATGGAYDITTGALSRAWGFVKGPKRVPPPDEMTDALERTGMKKLIFDDAARTVMATRPGVEINLGSIGKGYAIDRVVSLIRKHPWPTPAMVHGGRSSLYALGHQPGTLFEPWTIALHNPLDDQNPLVEIKLQDQAVGTSGGTFQSFESEGRSYGHIIDPRMGIPPLGPLSVTVIAPTAAEADALSTAFYLTGPTGAMEIARRNPTIGVLFLRLGPESGEPELLVLNVPGEKIRSESIQTRFVKPGEALPADWIHPRVD